MKSYKLKYFVVAAIENAPPKSQDKLCFIFCNKLSGCIHLGYDKLGPVYGKNVVKENQEITLLIIGRMGPSSLMMKTEMDGRLMRLTNLFLFGKVND